jgi:hypothetical protein
METKVGNPTIIEKHDNDRRVRPGYDISDVSVLSRDVQGTFYTESPYAARKKYQQNVA